MNHGIVREHITLYADLALIESFAISVEYSRNMTFNDFLLVDNKLFIANNSKGLGVLNIDKSYFKKSEHSYGIFNAQIKESNVNYKKIIGNNQRIKIKKGQISLTFYSERVVRFETTSSNWKLDAFIKLYPLICGGVTPQ